MCQYAQKVQFAQSGRSLVNPAQCRAGRVLAGLSQDELALRANVGRRTVIRFENAEPDVGGAVVEQLGRALGVNGVAFSEHAGTVGVSVPSAGRGQLRRAARALLGLSQEELAKAASVGRRAILGYEGDGSAGGTRLSTAVLVDAALRERGISFFEEEGRVGLLGPSDQGPAPEGG